MADRFFPNEMPAFVAEAEGEEAVAGDPLRRLLALPYPKAADRFLRSALDLKEKVVKETWVAHGQRVRDFTLYTGALGTALLLLKAFQVTNNRHDLNLCSDIVRACDAASQGSKSHSYLSSLLYFVFLFLRAACGRGFRNSNINATLVVFNFLLASGGRYVTFICGRAGVCAVGAVAAKHAGDDKLLNHYLSSFREIHLPPDVPNELLYGRAGYLWACSFLNKHIGEGTILPSNTVAVAGEMIAEGRKLARNHNCPLMYEWHGKKYWGAAHGLAGIMHVLMDAELSPEEQEYIKGTLHYMMRNRFPSGNYPSSDGSESDRLVHWCHGAPGVALTLAKASQVFGDEQFLHAAIDAAEVVWSRGLLKRVGMCHGVSGNAHAFLTLHRLTGKVEYLYRAKAFARFLLERGRKLMADGEMHGGDRPYSLFEGLGGMAYLFLDMVKPSESRFPAYEL